MISKIVFIATEVLQFKAFICFYINIIYFFIFTNKFVRGRGRSTKGIVHTS